MSETTNEPTAQTNTEAVATPETSANPERQELAEKIFDDGKSNNDPAPGQKAEEPAKSEEQPAEGAEGDDKPKEDKSGEETTDEKQTEDTTEKEEKSGEDVAINLPEGSSLSAEDKAEISGLIKDQNLTQDQADKLVGLMDKAVSRYQDSQVEQLDQRQNEWEKSFQIDKEIGGENQNMSISYAKKAIDHFGNENFKKELNETRLGSHPEVVRVFARIGRAMSDDKFVQPGMANERPKMMHDVFYNNDKQ